MTVKVTPKNKYLLKKRLKMSDDFRVSPQDIQIQRHAFPLYRKKETGGYSFSSTMTFVKAEGKYYCVFAAHALDRMEQDKPDLSTISTIGFLGTDGEFIALADPDISRTSIISKDLDLVICCTTEPFEGRNYFNLDPCEFNFDSLELHFYWLGFPASKAVKEVHKTKSSPEEIKSNYVNLEKRKFKNAEFLCINFAPTPISEFEIKGCFDNKDVTYEHAGRKSQGTSLKGMSGGPIFIVAKGSAKGEIRTQDSRLIFLGIGLEYSQKNKEIKGASLHAVRYLIHKMNGRS